MSFPSVCNASLASSSSFSKRLICASTWRRVAAEEELELRDDLEPELRDDPELELRDDPEPELRDDLLVVEREVGLREAGFRAGGMCGSPFDRGRTRKALRNA
jgi:hypothetical protein